MKKSELQSLRADGVGAAQCRVAPIGRALLVVLLAIQVSLLDISFARAAANTETEPERVSPAEIARETELPKGPLPYRPLRSLGGGLRRMFNRESGQTLAIGAAALFGARQFDEEANDYFAHKRRLGDLDHLGNDYLGTGVPGVLLAAGFWIYGDLTAHAYESHAGQAQIETLLVTSLLTAAMKGAVGRERPDGADRYSFPSGHTSTAFASAVVLHEFYGWKVGVPAYMLGALTGMSRMSEKKHWLSDTVGAALLGIWVGQSFSRAHLAQLESDAAAKKPRVSWYPVVRSDGAQLVFRVGF